MKYHIDHLRTCQVFQSQSQSASQVRQRTSSNLWLGWWKGPEVLFSFRRYSGRSGVWMTGMKRLLGGWEPLREELGHWCGCCTKPEAVRNDFKKNRLPKHSYSRELPSDICRINRASHARVALRSDPLRFYLSCEMRCNDTARPLISHRRFAFARTVQWGPVCNTILGSTLIYSAHFA